MKQLFQLYEGRELPACRSFTEFVDAGVPSAEDHAFWRERASLAPADMSVQADREATDGATLGEFVVGQLDISASTRLLPPGLAPFVVRRYLKRVRMELSATARLLLDLMVSPHRHGSVWSVPWVTA